MRCYIVSVLISVNELNIYLRVFILKQPKVSFNINITITLVFVPSVVLQGSWQASKDATTIFLWNSNLKSRAQNKNIREEIFKADMYSK